MEHTNKEIKFKKFWRWCITLSMTEFLDFIHRLEFEILENTTFRKLDLFPSSGEGGKTPTVLGPIKRANLYLWSSDRG
jgi:hypothetical protein